jgi:hypothetical protein
MLKAKVEQLVARSVHLRTVLQRGPDAVSYSNRLLKTGLQLPE